MVQCVLSRYFSIRKSDISVSVYVSKGENVFFIPDWRLLFQNLKHLLKAVTLENLISHRSLLHEGKLVLTGAHSCSAFYELAALMIWGKSHTIFLWFITREHKADRRLSVPVWRIPADHQDKEKQEGVMLCSQSERHHGGYLVVSLYRSFTVCPVFLRRGPSVQSRIPWGCSRTWSWISCWRRDAPSRFWISPSLWTDSSSRTLISSMPQVIIVFQNFSVKFNTITIHTDSYAVMIKNDYYWIIYVVSASGWVESTQQNQNVMLGLDEPPSVWCWQPVSRVTVDANGRITILCFLCSIGVASFVYNHAPEPLPAMHRCIHLASCVRVCQGRVTSTMNFSYVSFKSWRSTEYIL